MNEIKLPQEENGVVILFDGKMNVSMVTETPYFWDMLKSLGDDKSLQVIKKSSDGWKMTITIDMEKEG